MNSSRSSVATFFVAAVLSGCTTSGQVASQIVKTNMAQETAENQLLLLNVLRAVERRPMHFTQVTAVHLPLGFGNPGFSFALPFGGDPKGNVLTSSLSIPQSMDATFQNTQEFMRGITAPLPPSLMMYYLDQGWPSEMVLMLFVREIKLYPGKGAAPRVVTNYPESAPSFLAFSEVVTTLANCAFELEPDDAKDIGDPLPAAELQTVKALVAARAASLSIEDVPPAGGVGKRYQLKAPAKGGHIVLKKRNSAEEAQFSCQNEHTLVKPHRTPVDSRLGDDSKDKPYFELVLRSPEAMLYYLGEIARTQRDGQTTADGSVVQVDDGFPSIKYQELDAKTKNVKTARLFAVERGVASRSAVTVDYEGTTYSVPTTTKSDQSTHVLSMMSQIIAMQNKGSDLPGTATVHVVP